MARYITLLLVLMFVGCETSSQQIIKTEIFKYDAIKFDAVSKNLIYENFEKDDESEKIKKIVSYWFDNKIKTNGFEGSLDVILKNKVITKIKNKDHFKFQIDIIFEFQEKEKDLSISKIYNIKVTEYGEIKGNFSINDQENLVLNTIHKSLLSVNKKLNNLN